MMTTRGISLSTQLNRAKLIKFRYGPGREQQQKLQTAQASIGVSQGGPVDPAPAHGTIYDFQIPERWRRRPLSEEEIAVINNGGPL